MRCHGGDGAVSERARLAGELKPLVLVSGSTGYIGGRLVSRILDEGSHGSLGRHGLVGRFRALGGYRVVGR